MPQVQREIRRLEYEAEVASLQAEADALLSEAVVEGRVGEVPDGIRPLELDPAADGETETTVGDEAAAGRDGSRRDRHRHDRCRRDRSRRVRHGCVRHGRDRCRLQAPPTRLLRMAAPPANAAVDKA